MESQPDPEPEPEPVPEPDPEPSIEEPVPEPVVAGCEDLAPLESASLLGSLTSEQQSCLEKRIGGSETLTAQSKVSKILINNAKQAKNYKQWERHVKRHLDKEKQVEKGVYYGTL